MPSITTWSRHRAAVHRGGRGRWRRRPRLRPALAARPAVAGGRVPGRGRGTPVVARWRGQVASLRDTTSVRSPTKPKRQQRFRRTGPAAGGLRRASRRSTWPADGLRLGVDAGRQFLRLLGRPGHRARLRRRLPRRLAVPPLTDAGADGRPATSAYCRSWSPVAPSTARRLPRGAGPDRPARARRRHDRGRRPAEVRAACAAWLAWTDQLFSQPDDGEPAWQPDRMEYAFSVAGRVGTGTVRRVDADAEPVRRRRGSSGTASTSAARSTSARMAAEPRPATMADGHRPGAGDGARHARGRGSGSWRTRCSTSGRCSRARGPRRNC